MPLQAHLAHAGAMAERALAAAYPTLQQLLGAQPFAALARAHWHAEPPRAGDLACWGAGLPAFAAAAVQLAAEPYLADVAQLEWAVHQASSAADDEAAVQGVQHLHDADPQALWLLLRAGTAVVQSAYPVVTLWHAHRHTEPARPTLADARAALAAGRAEQALVWREGWQVHVAALTLAAAAFTRAVLQGSAVGAALHQAGPAFEFEAWLLRALREGWLAGAAISASPATPAPPVPRAPPAPR